jgi:hypothetical protein
MGKTKFQKEIFYVNLSFCVIWSKNICPTDISPRQFTETKFDPGPVS